MTRKVTASDVAKLAGVSQSAVSRYFSRSASVSKKTALAVRKAAEHLGYRPNVVARSLITGRSHVIGLVVAYLENQYYPTIMEQFALKLQQAGYNLQIFVSSLDADNVDEIVEGILACQLDGIIFASVTLSTGVASRCRSVGVPVILFNRSQDDLSISSVTSNNYFGGYKVARFLAERDHERIAYIAGLEDASTQRDREAGFRKGLEDSGLELFSRGKGNFNLHDAAAETRRIFSAEVIPDSVFLANDHMALAVMDVLRYELGLRVPDDVAVVGYDDILPASWLSYQLTTVRQPDRMVDKTVELLLDQIASGILENDKVIIDGPIIERRSTRPMPKLTASS